jgi:hypothetical protein
MFWWGGVIMLRIAPSRRWTRAIVAAAVAVALRASPARADVSAPPEETTHVGSLPLPAPGTHRLIRLGPQMLVMQDDQGRFTMADEPTEKPKRGRSLAAVTAVFGVIGVGLVILGLQNLELDGGEQPGRRLP